MVKSKVPLGTGGKLEFASNLRCRPFSMVLSSSSSSSLSDVSVSSMISETSEEVGSLGSDVCSWRLESGGEIGKGLSPTTYDEVLGGKGGGEHSSS